MEGLLKGSCDACTASKVKCSGGNPCSRCSQKDIACSYRPKRKRGPQRAKSSKRSAPSDENFAFVSTYEKRVWSTFFTMFKNQNRNRNKAESEYAWCWFASQLDKLRTHLNNQRNEGALKRLGAWLEALDVDMNKIISSGKSKCIFAAHQCGQCAALAMSAPIQRVVPLTRDMISGQSATKMFDDHSRPRLLFETRPEGSTVEGNQAFANEFGLSNEDVERLIEWSGGGFLPWGGDLLARLLVNESDLLLLLQILALKWQALGPPNNNSHMSSQREVPSTHVFDLWGPDLTTACTYLVHCLHTERVDNMRMQTQALFTFERIGSPRPKTSKEVPVSLTDGRPASAEKRPRGLEDVVVKQETFTFDTPQQPSPGDRLATNNMVSQQVNSVVQTNNTSVGIYPNSTPVHPQYPSQSEALPEKFSDYYGNWDTFENTGNMSNLPAAASSSPTPSPYFQRLDSLDFPIEPPTSDEVQNGTLAEEGLDRNTGNTSGDDDAVWLDSLLDWSLQKPSRH